LHQTWQIWQDLSWFQLLSYQFNMSWNSFIC
jgi:hypothetical protein